MVMPRVKLLEDVLEAHGGLARWRQTRSLSARLALRGPFWAGRGWPEGFDVTVLLATQREHIEIVYPDRVAVFEVGPERLTLRTRDGRLLEVRDDPRASFPVFDGDITRWDAVQVAYFQSRARWSSFTGPFLLAQPGVEIRELAPWDERGETWQRLAATFPPANGDHNTEQVLYFDADLLLRRMDRAPEVTASPPLAEYSHDHVVVDGLVFATRRRVHLRDADGEADRGFALITIDVADIALGHAR
jgi:hypothetical protein